MRVFVAGKPAERSWQDDDGNKRQTVEIQVTHVGPDPLRWVSVITGKRNRPMGGDAAGLISQARIYLKTASAG